MQPPDFRFASIIQRLEERANRGFSTIPDLVRLPSSARETTVLFTGFLDNEEPPRAFFFVMSNAERFRAAVDPPREGFVFIRSREARPYDPDFTMVQRVGNWRPMTGQDEDMLRLMFAEHRPATAIVGKAVELIRNIADRPLARGTIGKQISSIVLPRDPTEGISTQFHSNVVSYHSFMPDSVFALDPECRNANYGAT
jgi:hypothetical protein